MSGRYGTITATLADVNEISEIDALAELINSRIRPLEPVTANDIFVRGMYLVSDEVNSFGGRFPVDEYPTLLEKLINTPVLVGHRKDSLPIGRTFHALHVERNGRQWVKSLFYWLKSTEGAQMLADNIDGGIYQECSIGFIYRLPECSVCGKDIRQCEHQVFSHYASGSTGTSCHFIYREIEKVLESSLVYRGANPDTGMSRELAEGGFGEADTEFSAVESVNAGDNEQLLVIPWYPSVSAKLVIQAGKVSLERVDGTHIGRDLAKQLPVLSADISDSAIVHIVGYRGKERCSEIALERYLANKPSPVTRIELKLMPDIDGKLTEWSHACDGNSPMRPIRYRIVNRAELAEAGELLCTKDGVRVWLLKEYEPCRVGTKYTKLNLRAQPMPTYQLSVDMVNRTAYLTNKNDKGDTCYALQQFDAKLWQAGRSFLADAVTTTNIGNASPIEQAMSALIRPVILRGRKCFLLRSTLTTKGRKVA